MYFWSLVYEKYFKDINQTIVTILYAIFKVNLHFFKVKPSCKQRSNKTFNHTSTCSHKRATYEIVHMDYYYTKTPNTPEAVVQKPQDCNFSCEFYEILKKTFFIEHLWWLLLTLGTFWKKMVTCLLLRSVKIGFSI